MKNEKLDLEIVTRIILVFGIIFLLGGIIYLSTRPEEQDLLFFLLNENQELRDYPTNTTLDESVSYYLYIENQLGSKKDFCVRSYLCESNYTLNPQVSVNNSKGTQFLFSQTVALKDNQEWISEKEIVKFNKTGLHQIIVVELWQKMENSWVYIPDYMLTLKISVYE